MNYENKRSRAVAMITKYGAAGTLLLNTITKDEAQQWKQTTTVTELPVKCVLFDDDGETFVDHNVTGYLRIANVAPDPELTDINIGDKLVFGGMQYNIHRIKQLNPDGSGAILWALLLT